MLFSSDVSKFTKKLETFSKKEISDIMTKDVMTISAEDSLIDAANIMIGHHISSLIVIARESKKPLGIITERDFMVKAPHEEKKLKSMKVKNLMTRNPVSVEPSLHILDANEIMQKHKFRKLVVMKDEELLGIITQTDLVRALDEFYRLVPFKTSDCLPIKAVKVPACILKTTDKISVVQKKMAKYPTGTAFVTDGKSIVGMFTEFDFLSELALQPEEMHKQKVGDVMSFPVVAVDGEVDLLDANHLMLEKNFRRLPVIEGGKNTGKLSQTEVRQAGYDIINTTIKRMKEKELEEVNFQMQKKPRELVRKITGRVQEFTYP